MTTVPLVEVRDLNLRFALYRGVSHVLKDVSMDIRPQERVALVGESGCGKSVFARVLLGLMAQRNVTVDGRVRFGGVEVTRLSQRRWRKLRGRKITMVFQDPHAALNPVFTIGQQFLEVIRRGRPGINRAGGLKIARAQLRTVAIDDPDRVLRSYPFQLSGGMAQRVLITMAIVNRPDLILADEPGTALDVTVQEQTLRLMRRLADESGTAVLLIAHNLGVVRAFAQRVYVMYGGMIVEDGPVEPIFADPKHPYTKALLAAVPRLSGGALPEPIPGTVPDYLDPPPGCRFMQRCPHARPECSRTPPRVHLPDGRRVLCVLYDDGTGAAPDG